MTCSRAQEFLARCKVSIKKTLDARKNALDREAALEFASQADEIYVSKGKKVVHVDMKVSGLNKSEVAELLLGPTGNLRAPTLKCGRTLIVGFDEDTYRELLL